MANPVIDYRESAPQRVRVLFAIGLTSEFFSTPEQELRPILDACKEAFRDLDKRFGVTVLGTLDDDETMIGARSNWPWTCYILAEAPNRHAVSEVCNQLRETKVGITARLWRFMTIEARVGRPLFFAEA